MTKEKLLTRIKMAGGCWNYTGYIEPYGYGRLYHGGHKWLAHRLSYFLFVGEIADGLDVCHTCDNTKCINPEHLFLGTHQDNMRDRDAKGRNNIPKGEKSHTAKLKQSEVDYIRRHYKPYDPMFSGAKLARKFGVKKCTIGNIVKGRIWRTT